MEHRHDPGGFSGKSTGIIMMTCDLCGTTFDVLHQATGGGDAHTYAVRCPNHACNALLEVELTSPPIAVMPHP
ncbi:MAG TPA: hypothetical protein VFX12_07280 [Vicinamibacterales bacterium]|nr:hypothetical protein [Vicinamibacterales bacterium]